MVIHVEPIVKRAPISEMPREWDPDSFAPWDSWNGAPYDEVQEYPCDVATFEYILGLDRADVEKTIRDNPDAFSHLFDITKKEIVPKFEMMIRTWITINRPHLRPITIPYGGPRSVKVRVDRDTWIETGFVARYEVDRKSEVLGFSTKTLLEGGLDLENTLT
uniref:Uncharacterized protein n=1 Tax=viral metagenome TaxID=1070528 RepID=A0A2V0RAQ6_9ZZZZ